MTRPNIEQWAFAAILAAAAAPTLGQPQPAAGQAGAERADGQPAEASTELSNSQGISWLQRALIVRQKMKNLHHPSIYLEKHTKKFKAII